MAANRNLDERIAAMQERNRRNRRRVATLGTIVAVVVAAALIVPALSATRDTATSDAGFFFAGQLDQKATPQLVSTQEAASELDAGDGADGVAATNENGGGDGTDDNSSGAASGVLAAFVTDAQLVIDGKTYGKNELWNVYPDVNYDLKITFTEKGSNQFPKSGEVISMDLPEGLHFEESGVHKFDIPGGLAGTVTGNEYWVEDGKLYIRIGNDPEDIITRSSNAHFTLTIASTFDKGTKNVEFNQSVNPKVDVKDNANLDVSKTATYNKQTGMMDYTLTVKATGKSEKVTVSDRLKNSNLLMIDYDTIAVEPSGTEYSVDKVDNGFDLTLANGMAHGEIATIRYSAKVNTTALEHNGTIKNADDATNTVVADNGEGGRDEDTFTYKNKISYGEIEKSNVSTEEKDGKTVMTWKIVLNEDFRGSLVGDTLKDSIDWNSREAMKYASPLTLSISAKDASGKAYSKEVTINNIGDNSGQESWSYVIEQLGDDSNEVLAYEITYQTVVDKTKLNADGNGNAFVRNNASIEDVGTNSSGIVPNAGYSGSGGSGGGSSIVGGKVASEVTEEYITWDIVVNVPAEGYPDGFTITDDIPYQRKYRDTFVGIEAVDGLINQESYSVDVADVHHNELDPVGKTRQVVTLTFFQDGDIKQDPGLDSSQNGRTLTVKIKTKNDPDWVSYAETQPGGDPIYYHTNNARVNDTSFKADAIPLHTSLTKEQGVGVSYQDGLPVYEYKLILSNVTKELDPVVIEDVFNTELFEYAGPDPGWKGHDGIACASQKHELNNVASGYTVNITQTETGVSIKADSLPKKEDGSYWEYYAIYYRVKVKDAEALEKLRKLAIENNGVYKIHNEATWDDFSDEYDIDYKVPVVDKSGAFAVGENEGGNTRKFNFTIQVNEGADTLNGGEPMDLTDTHSSNLTVEYHTVKVYRYEKDGTEVEDKSIVWNFDGNIGTFYALQDSTHYKIAYECLVIGTGQQTVSNHAELDGRFSDELTAGRYYKSDVDAGADVYQINLLKFRDGATSQGLEGATFQLFRGSGNYTWVTEGEYSWGVEDKIPVTYGDGTITKRDGLVGENVTFTTNEDGYVQIALNQTEHGAELEEGVHYYLKEIESPAGYQIDSSVEYWEFTLTSDAGEVSYGAKRNEYNNRIWMYFSYDDILKMNNTPTTEPLSVKVDKTWVDINGQKMEDLNGYSATVQLMRKTNNEPYVAIDKVVSESGEEYDGKVTLSNEKDWSFVWKDLPREDSDGNLYAYKVEEIESFKDGEPADDFVASVKESETETEKSYSISNIQVQERNADLQVAKKWKQSDGKTDLVENLPDSMLPDSVQFYIYQVVSRVPFEIAPVSGGNPYNIEGSPFRDASDDGLYRMSKSDYENGIWFKDLPSAKKVTEGGKTEWYFYSYYVREVGVDGFDSTLVVSMSENATQGQGVRQEISAEMTNIQLPGPVDLTVKKQKSLLAVWRSQVIEIIR